MQAGTCLKQIKKSDKQVQSLARAAAARGHSYRDQVRNIFLF
jgi:hypothetical protein